MEIFETIHILTLFLPETGILGKQTKVKLARLQNLRLNKYVQFLKG